MLVGTDEGPTEGSGIGGEVDIRLEEVEPENRRSELHSGLTVFTHT